MIEDTNGCGNDKVKKNSKYCGGPERERDEWATKMKDPMDREKSNDSRMDRTHVPSNSIPIHVIMGHRREEGKKRT